MTEKDVSKRNLIIKINEIPTQGMDLTFKNGHKELDFVLSDLLAKSPTYDVTCTLKSASNMIHLKGSAKGQIRLTCSRCAESFNQDFDKEFVTAYYKSEENMSGLNEIDELGGSFDIDFIKSNEINLGEAIHEQIALEIPFQPFCVENCKGLCFQCGTNLNFEVCNCKNVKHFNPISPFSALKELKGES